MSHVNFDVDTYLRVQVVWDEDHDERIYEAISILLTKWHLAGRLLAAGEHEGILTILVLRPATSKEAALLNELSSTGLELSNDYWVVDIRTAYNRYDVYHLTYYNLDNIGSAWNE